MAARPAEIAIVTGSARGIGAAIARRVAEAGHAVAVWDFDATGAEAVAGSLVAEGRRAIACRCDVASESDVEAAAKATVAALGTPTLLVNNAAVRHRVPLEDLPRASWDREIAVNLTGAFQCTKTVGRLMLTAGRGSIVNIASMSGTFGQAVRGAYTPSKAGIIGLTSLTAVEWGGRGIRCNAISPGMIVTPAHVATYADAAVKEGREAMIPAGRLGTGEDIADVVLFLASEAARYVNGANVPVDGGVSKALTALMPMPGAGGGVLTTLDELRGR